MYEFINILPGKLRWLIFGTFILLSTSILFALLLLLPAPKTSANVSTNSNAPADYTMGSYDSPNAITNGLAMGADEVIATIDTMGQAFSSGSRSVITSISMSGESAAHGLRSSASFVGDGLHTGTATVGRGMRAGASHVGHGLGNSAIFTVRAISNGMELIDYIPKTVINYAADTTVVSAVIEPSKNTPIPTIDTTLPATIATPAAVPATVTTTAEPASQTAASTTLADSAAIWPIHGQITTLFGVPHWPYQPTHTGIDISDGQRSGVTPIKPFKPGRVIDTIHSNSGLGNHIVVDHGNGMTSVYGHLYSISVEIGQAVDKSTVLGFEGTTGASTGTHLHFEIRLNGLAVDPRQFINGLP